MSSTTPQAYPPQSEIFDEHEPPGTNPIMKKSHGICSQSFETDTVVRDVVPAVDLLFTGEDG